MRRLFMMPASNEVGDVVLCIQHPNGEVWLFQSEGHIQDWPTEMMWDQCSYPENDRRVCYRTALMWSVDREWVVVQHHQPLVVLHMVPSC